MRRQGSSFTYFMQLAPELRRIIYIDLLTLNRPARYRYRLYPYKQIPPHPTAIFLACQRIYQEARPIFFQRNLFVTSTPRMISTLLRATPGITHLLCRLHCVLRNDVASCGMLKVLANCSNLYLLKISVKAKDMAELMYHGAWDDIHGFNILTSNFGSDLLGKDKWDDFKRQVMSNCKVEFCHVHTRDPEQCGRQRRCLEIDLKATT